jgi:hypothetical protein
MALGHPTDIAKRRTGGSGRPLLFGYVSIRTKLLLRGTPHSVAHARHTVSSLHWRRRFNKAAWPHRRTGTNPFYMGYVTGELYFYPED